MPVSFTCEVVRIAAGGVRPGRFARAARTALRTFHRNKNNQVASIYKHIDSLRSLPRAPAHMATRVISLQLLALLSKLAMAESQEDDRLIGSL